MGTLNLQNTQTATDRDKIFEFMSRDMDLQLGFRIDKEDPETAKKVSYTQRKYCGFQSIPNGLDHENAERAGSCEFLCYSFADLSLNVFYLAWN